jgi:molybdopterin-guanine dinucleotide biosynthesis protein A
LFDREVTDEVGGEGPLRGVLTALEGAGTEAVAVVTVDMPGVGREQVEWVVGQLGDSEGVMCAREAGRVEPFPLVVRKRVRPVVERRLGEGRRSVHALRDVAGVRVVAAPVEWGERVWVNLNRREDLRAWDEGDPGQVQR